MRIAVVHGNDGTDVRIGKTCRSLSSMGYETYFVGWDRRPDQPKEVDLGATTTAIMSYPTAYGRATVRGQLAFARHAWRWLRRTRPDVVCAVNEDNAFCLLPLRGLGYRFLVCDVFDALVDRHSRKPWALRQVLRLVSGIVRGRSDALIATSDARRERFGRHRGKCVVVENVPEPPAAGLSPAVPSGPVKVYVTGTLTRGRGLEQVLDVVHQTGAEIVCTGWALDAYARETFVTDPRVRFRGIVTARQSLKLACECDAVLALYAPDSANNLMASPNKVYDAMSIGRPVIINHEVEGAQSVVAQGLGYACAYDDTGALAEIVSSLAARRAGLPAFQQHTRALLEAGGHTWPHMETRLKALYDGFARRV